eukprot:Skav234441  [mRNA]  locus=scaffold1647:4283:15111:+ [translate_table: standard]
MAALKEALYYAVFFDIAVEHLAAFEHGLTQEAQAVERLEPKTARFHLWQSSCDASRWVVLEAFREPAGWGGVGRGREALGDALRSTAEVQLTQRAEARSRSAQSNHRGAAGSGCRCSQPVGGSSLDRGSCSVSSSLSLQGCRWIVDPVRRGLWLAIPGVVGRPRPRSDGRQPRQQFFSTLIRTGDWPLHLQALCAHRLPWQLIVRRPQGPVFAAMVDIDMAPLDEEEETNELNISSFDYLEMTQEQAEVTQEAWEMFLDCYESSEGPGEALHDAVIDASPTLSTLFKMPRAVTAMRFQEGLHQIINSLTEPQDVKNLVDILGFKHLNLELTVAKVEVIRDAILELMGNELGGSLTKEMALGLLKVLNYIGGALIYIRSHYADRVKILNESWVEANREKDRSKQKEREAKEKARQEEALAEEEAHAARMQKRRKEKEHDVPKTFYDMFCFNAAVMDLLEPWMYEILDCFEVIVLNAANTFRLQEECDVLTLKIAKIEADSANIKLSDFKAVMLASLRSLVPKGWSSSHEAAWSWLWEQVENLLRRQLDRTHQREVALTQVFASMDDQTRQRITWALYGKFFELVPAGQDYFKQSASRLAMIASRVLDMSLELFKYPYRMVDEISALGLRHVGYAIPVEYFGPFVSACIETLQTEITAEKVIESFAWSLGLVSRMLVRTMKEGSTIVMKAINENDKELLRSALGCAPRGERADWVLTVSVGTQSISPLMWAIESGNWRSAELIIEDLLTIRADREKYYYGLDQLFLRHPDFVEILATKATSLLWTLFDGMVWRSHLAQDGLRRTNYYIKHFVIDSEGKFPEAIDNLVTLQNPSVALHPFVVCVSDIIWSKVVRTFFVREKAWQFIALLIFVISHGVLHADRDGLRITLFVFKALIYLVVLPLLIYGRVRYVREAIGDKEMVKILGGRIPIPQRYIDNWREPACLLLAICLLISVCLEPILHCLDSSGDFDGAGLFTDACPEVEHIREVYNTFAMVVIALYMALLMDLATLSTQLGAYVLVVLNVLPELFLMLIGVGFFILMFATCMAVSLNDVASFQTFPMAMLRLFQFSIKTNSEAELVEIAESPVLAVAMGAFVALVILGNFSIFVAQLTCAHQEIYASMVGYACLRRMQIEVDSVQNLKQNLWKHFVDGLRLDEPLERLGESLRTVSCFTWVLACINISLIRLFGEGDIGLAGGIQRMECAKAHPQYRESIQRFGGSTSSRVPWPRENLQANTEDERLDKAMKKFTKAVAIVAKKTLKMSDLGSNLSGLSLGSKKSKSSNSSNGSSSASAEEDTKSNSSTKSEAE